MSSLFVALLLGAVVFFLLLPGKEEKRRPSVAGPQADRTVNSSPAEAFDGSTVLIHFDTYLSEARSLLKTVEAAKLCAAKEAANLESALQRLSDENSKFTGAVQKLEGSELPKTLAVIGKELREGERSSRRRDYLLFGSGVFAPYVLNLLWGFIARSV